MPIQWNQIGANFNDANSAMRNATEGISKAGTIFGELRRQIIEEEQKAIDNAYREKAFNENVRQFGLKHALEQDNLNERIRANKAGEANTRRGQDLSHKAAMANVGVNQARLAFEQNKWNTQLNKENTDRETLAAIATNLIANREELNKKINDTEKLYNSTTDLQEKSKLNSLLNTYRQERQSMSDTGLDNAFRTQAARNGIFVDNTPFTSGAKLEQDRLQAAKAARTKERETITKDIANTTKIINDLNLTAGQQELAQKALIKAKTLYPNIPSSVLASVIAELPKYNAYFDFSGKNAFTYDEGSNDILLNFINGQDLNNNIVNQAFASKALEFMRNNK